MSAPAHAERSHAILSASGSKRWLTCTPSAKLEQGFPEEESTFAAEGTFAHELSEIHLSYYLGQIKRAAFNRELKKRSDHPFYSQEMLDYIQTYVDIAAERINEAKAQTNDAVVLIEQRLDFSNWVPQGFGTGDIVIIADGTLEIIDLKYGKGVPVSAEENTQMRLYALGALHQFEFLYDIERVRMTIVQPRLDTVSTDEISVGDLLEWANEIVKPRAEMAIKGEGEFSAGEHCRFCRARYTCRERAESNLQLARYEFQNPPLLTHEEVAEVLMQAESLQKWAADIQSYALEQAEKFGVRFPGWKLVEGRSNRKYIDKASVADTLILAGYQEDLIYEPREILGISAMEKAIGKKQFGELLTELVIKPTGKPTLVHESDKRPELNSVASAVEDFK
ncbi:MAG TPA: DUF2800 domain-containing protein [Candidatus Binatia bacterium]|nr:DUF2800 domain-containing protein [Candidatus Binatia bacterium]